MVYQELQAELDDSDFLRKSRVARHRSPHFWEKEVPRWDDARFKSNFRVDRTTFNLIREGVQDLLSKDKKGRGAPLPPDKVCAIGLWRLKEGQASYQTIGTQFQVGKTTAQTATIAFVQSIIAVFEKDYVHFPQNQEEVADASTKFAAYSKGVFSGAIGAIDGTHIPIHKPDEKNDKHHRYINRKNKPSLNCMAVVDRNRIFNYFLARWPGSVGDARILANCGLASGSFLPGGHYLIGDAGFPLKPWLLTPYRESPNMHPDSRLYNEKLSSSRMVVEQSFGELKSRWRVLLHGIHAIPERAAEMALSCVILHNICRMNDDRWHASWTVPRSLLE